jgi:hypothetical protein
MTDAPDQSGRDDARPDPSAAPAASTPEEKPREAEKDRPRRRLPTWLKVTGGVLATIVIAVVLFLMFADWNMLRGPIGRFASARLDRTVQLRGDLNVHPFSWTPRAEINDLYVADTRWSGTDHLARIDRVEVAIKILPLLKGDVILQRLALVKPDINLARSPDGKANWKFKEPKNKKPGKAPIVRQLFIQDGRIRYRDRQRGLMVNAAASASETQNGGGFRLAGDGSINGEPFRLRVGGGPLIYISKDKPYPFDARIDAGSTRLVARGSINEPFDLARFGSSVDLSGPDLNRLYGLTGLALPNTPPYRVRGRLERRGTLYQVTRLNGTVGDSDVGGTLSIETKGERPFLKADLRSRRLDFDDMATIFGGAPDPRETASAEQKAVAAKLKSQQRLLPDATLQVDRVRAMDAEVKYRATSILAPGLPLKDASLGVDLKAGLLKVQNIRVGFPQGQLTGYANIDARKTTPLVDMDLRMSGVRLEQFLTKTGATPISGTLVARAKLAGSGNSVHRFASNADGSVTVVVPGGQVREAFAELIGINVIKGLGLLLSKDTGTTDLRCAVADFRVQDGNLLARQILVDTEPVLITGNGGGSLDNETLNLVLKGNPKKFRLVSLNAPVTIQGSIRAPKIGVRPGGAIAQGGIAAALGAMINPIAAILPFVDPGLTKDANCSALMSGAAQKGAPVRQQAARR